MILLLTKIINVYLFDSVIFSSYLQYIVFSFDNKKLTFYMLQHTCSLLERRQESRKAVILFCPQPSINWLQQPNDSVFKTLEVCSDCF